MDRNDRTGRLQPPALCGGPDPKSITAIANLKRLCEKHLMGLTRVGDLMKTRWRSAVRSARPTLIRHLPEPLKRSLAICRMPRRSWGEPISSRRIRRSLCAHCPPIASQHCFLSEAEETIGAIHGGDVDAVVVARRTVFAFMLEGADQPTPYGSERMSDGALRSARQYDPHANQRLSG
jgi:hypothetical protein